MFSEEEEDRTAFINNNQRAFAVEGRHISYIYMNQMFKVGYLEELYPLNIKWLLINLLHQILPDPTKSNTIILIAL